MWTHVCRLRSKQTTSAGQIQISLQLLGRFLLNSVKFGSNPKWIQAFLLLVAQDHSSDFAVSEEWRAVFIGTLGDRWATICLFFSDPPSLYSWPLSLNATTWSGSFSPFSLTTLFIIHADTQVVLISQDIVHHSIIQLLFSFSISNCFSQNNCLGARDYLLATTNMSNPPDVYYYYYFPGGQTTVLLWLTLYQDSR